MCTLNLAVSQLVGGKKIDSEDMLIIRASKYESKDKLMCHYRVSVAKDMQLVEYDDNVKTADNCRYLFEHYQEKYLGAVKQPFRTYEFL